METNFFKKMAQMDINSKLTLTIGKGTENTLVVTIFVENDACADKAKFLIPPFNIEGTPDELDEGFFDYIRTPLNKADGLLSNMENFYKQLEIAEKNSAMEKQKADNERKAKEAKNKKYNEIMLKAEALEQQGRFKEAWTALPKASDYPENAKAIRAKQELYEPHFVSNLFTESPVHPVVMDTEETAQEQEDE